MPQRLTAKQQRTTINKDCTIKERNKHGGSRTKKKRGRKRQADPSVYRDVASKRKKKRRINEEYYDQNNNSIKQNRNNRYNENKSPYNAYAKKYNHGNYLINTDTDWKDYHCNVPYYDIGDQDVECEHCGALFWHDERLSHKNSQKNVFGSLCCNYGKIDIPLPKELPPYLHSLFFGNTVAARYFQENIRAFNSLFTFATVKSRFKPKHQNKGSKPAPYVYRCEGVLHHYMGPLEADKTSTPCSLQIYMHDSDEAIEYRCNMFDLDNKPMARNIITGIQKEIEKHNPWIKQFRNFYEDNKDKKTKNISLIIEKNPTIPKGRHKKQYGEVTANQIGALIKRNNNSKKKQYRDLVLRLRGGGLKNINEAHGLCDPASYPILLPYGTEGWCKNSQLSGVSCLEYYRYLLHERPYSKNHMFKAKKLSQQYWVDMWVKIDQLRLNSYKSDAAQRKYRKYFVSGLEQAKREGKDLDDIGFPTILPSSFTGGPRYMNQRMHDSLAIVRKYK
eukprot:762904_1